MLVDDETVKQRLMAVADQENRSVNNWLQTYILPVVMREMESRERAFRPYSPATTTLTDKMTNDAKRGLRK